MKSRKKSIGVKAVKKINGWMIVDRDGLVQMVEACDSDRFIWRRFIGKESALNKEEYERWGYRCIRVLISPL